jgi:TolC family type I secretion outer membrane protein
VVGVVVALAGPGSAGAQTFLEALTTTYVNNPTLRAARAELRAVDESVAQALSNWRPEISVDGFGGAQYTDTQSDFFSDKGGSQPRGGELNVIQPLYRGGRTESATNAAEAEVLSQRARLKSVEQDVLFEATVSYVDVWRDQSVLELNINNEQVLQRNLEASRDRFEVGEITRTDVAQSESRLARATADRIAADGNLSSSRAVFQRVVGDYPGQLTQPDPAAGLPKQLDELMAISLANDPEVIASEFAENAARADVRTVLGELLPSARLRGSLRYDDDQGISSTERQQAEIIAEVTIPLYQQGAASSRVRQARQIAMQRRIEVDEARALARQGSIVAWEVLVTNRAQIESFRSEVATAEIALEGVRQENEVGERTVLDVLDAEQELLDAQVNLATARRDELVASYAMLRAMGRFTAEDLSLDVDLYDPAANYRDVRDKWFGLEIDDSVE